MSAKYVSKADLEELFKWGGAPDPFAPFKPNARGEFLIAEQADDDLAYPSTLVIGPAHVRDAVVERLRAAERECYDHVAQFLVSPIMQREHDARDARTSGDPPAAGAPIFRDAKPGDQIPTTEPVALFEWFCPNIGRERARRIAAAAVQANIPISVGNLRSFIAARWEEPSPLANGSGKPVTFQVTGTDVSEPCLTSVYSGSIKVWTGSIDFKPGDSFAFHHNADGSGYPIVNGRPTQLAAGQVWERQVGTTTQRRTIASRDPRNENGWFTEERPDMSTPGHAFLSMPEWRYLGTREEVAVRSRRATSIEASVERNTDLVKRAARSEEERIRRLNGADRSLSDPPPGSRGWLLARLSEALDVATYFIHLDETVRGVVRVTVEGRSIVGLADALSALQREMPIGGVRLVAGCGEAERRTSKIRNAALDLSAATGQSVEWIEDQIRRIAVPDQEPPTMGAIRDHLRGMACGAERREGEGLIDWHRRMDNAERTASRLGADPLPGLRIEASGPRLAPERDRAPVEGERDTAFEARKQRAAIRAEVDRLIKADSGPFVRARAAALRAACEVSPPSHPEFAATFMALLCEYEAERGGTRVPARAVTDLPRGSKRVEAALAVYERERAR